MSWFSLLEWESLRLYAVTDQWLFVMELYCTNTSEFFPPCCQVWQIGDTCSLICLVWIWYCTQPQHLESHSELFFHDVQIRAQDGGQPQRSHTTRVAVQVVAAPTESAHPPQVKLPNQRVEVTESDQEGYLVTLIQGYDEDKDFLWYDIVGM